MLSKSCQSLSYQKFPNISWNPKDHYLFLYDPFLNYLSIYIYVVLEVSFILAGPYVLHALPISPVN
jgi:hypothetical protein